MLMQFLQQIGLGQTVRGGDVVFRKELFQLLDRDRGLRGRCITSCRCSGGGGSCSDF